MAATYPDQLAAGRDDLGRFDPFELMGPGPIRDDRAQVADAQAIEQFQVLTYNSAGRLIPWLGTSEFAKGTITFTAQPTAADTITINGQAITFVDDDTPAANEVNIEDTLAETLAATAALINAAPATFAVWASVSGNVLTLTALVQGTGGNTIALADSSTNTTVSGATLDDVLATTASPPGKPVAVAMQPIAAATPGAYCPIRVMGTFNHEKLVWPAGVGTLAQRRLAFAGTPLSVIQLL